MTCSLVRSLLDEYVDRELPVNTLTALKEHLDICSICQAELDELNRLRSALSESSCPEPPEEYWGELRDLILARTVEVDTVVKVQSEVDRRARERSSFYRSILTVAASLTVFLTSLWLGSSRPLGSPVRSDHHDSETDRITYLTTVSTGTGTISTDEQALIASGMLLVGTPGMFASPTEMTGILGFNQTR